MRRVASLVAVALSVWPALAAEQHGGVRGELILGFGILLDRDPDLDGLADDTAHALSRLKLAVSSETRTQSLRFGFRGRSVSSAGPQTSADLRYSRKSAASLLSLSLSDTRTPKGFANFETDLGARDATFDLTSLSSEVREQRAAWSLRTGIDRPLGLELGVNLARRRVDNPRVRHTDYAKFLARINLRLSGASALSVQAETAKRDRDVGQDDDDEGAVLATLEYGLSETRKITGSVGWRDVTASGQTSSGLEWSVHYATKARDAHMFVSASQRQVGGGRISRARLGFGHATGGSDLQVWVGVAQQTGGSGELVGSARFTRETALAAFEVAIDRRFVPSFDTGETRLASDALVALRKQLGSRGALSISIEHQETAASTSQAAREAQRIRALYVHEANREWSVVAGAQRRVRREAGTARLGSNSVFLTLERRFAGRM